MEYIVETENLSKVYNKNYVLRDVNIKVPKGSIYGIIGRNGAGKTTLQKILVSLIKPTTGKYTMFNGKSDINILKRVGSLIEQPSLNKNLSAFEVLEYYRILYGIPNKEKTEEILKLIGLENTDKKKCKNFSLGMKQRLGIGIALLGNPDLLILDEPINGLDSIGVNDIRTLLLMLNKEKNITIIISSHILSELSKIATHYAIFDSGYLKKELTKDELEKEVRKCILLEVGNITKTVNLLELQLNITNYKIIGKNKIKVFEKITINEICKILIDNDIEIQKIEESCEEIESYYLNLVGGKND